MKPVHVLGRKGRSTLWNESWPRLEGVSFRPSAAVCGDVSSHRRSSAVDKPLLARGHVACVSNPGKNSITLRMFDSSCRIDAMLAAGHVDEPTELGKQNTMLALRTAFKDKVGGRYHRSTAKQLLIRTRRYNCGKPPGTTQTDGDHNSEKGASSKSHGQSCVDLFAKCR